MRTSAGSYFRKSKSAYRFTADGSQRTSKRTPKNTKSLRNLRNSTILFLLANTMDLITCATDWLTYWTERRCVWRLEPKMEKDRWRRGTHGA